MRRARPRSAEVTCPPCHQNGKGSFIGLRNGRPPEPRQLEGRKYSVRTSPTYKNLSSEQDKIGCQPSVVMMIIIITTAGAVMAKH